ncbi:acyl-CoA carboxylase epsilon subunit [Streptomyces apocyni]|uniref:acyl-CoA carboxylase epsilon subunit n=1 Tax=Streptomyces apocyni TaxID=2654677 RepID=UPI0012E995A6|nr:acyl-CoA carboxylase epsilon subunit [Streptomyces apocyni]
MSALEGPLGPSLLRVIEGKPTPEELAAVAMVLMAASLRASQPTDPDAGMTVPARWQRAGVTSSLPGSWMARS